MPCEHVFSSGKETMSAHHSWIKYDLMEALQMLKYSLNHNHKLNFTTRTGQQAELQELEELDKDLMTFQCGFAHSVEDNGTPDPF